VRDVGDDLSVRVGLERGQEPSERVGLLRGIGVEPRVERALELRGSRASRAGAGAVGCGRGAGGKDQVWGRTEAPLGPAGNMPKF
jgi:hypothetical protein